MYIELIIIAAAVTLFALGLRTRIMLFAILAFIASFLIAAPALTSLEPHLGRWSARETLGFDTLLVGYLVLGILVILGMIVRRWLGYGIAVDAYDDDRD